jgi:hypothetical protein
VDIFDPWFWLHVAPIAWVVISLLAAPLVGRFVAGALRERTGDHQRTTTARASDVGEAPRTAPFSRLKARM